jgi:hypothetical protein
MLDLMERELAIGRKEVLALASIAVDLRITQLVNAARGCTPYCHWPSMQGIGRHARSLSQSGKSSR